MSAAVHQRLTERTRKIVADHLDVEHGQVTSDAFLINDLGADSLDYIELAMALEEEFGVEIDDAGLEDARTFGDLVKLVADNLHYEDAKQ